MTSVALFPAILSSIRVITGEKLMSYEILLNKDKTLLKIHGGIDYGLVNSVAETIKNNKNINTIELNSSGGRVSEGRELSKIINQLKLNTQTTTGCISACTIAYLAGNSRYLVESGYLGFHEYIYSFNVPLKYFDYRYEFSLAKEKGINLIILENGLNTPSLKLYIPSRKELLQSKIVTKILDRLPLENPPLEFNQRQVNNQSKENIPQRKKYVDKIIESVMITQMVDTSTGILFMNNSNDFSKTLSIINDVRTPENKVTFAFDKEGNIEEIASITNKKHIVRKLIHNDDGILLESITSIDNQILNRLKITYNPEHHFFEITAYTPSGELDLENSTYFLYDEYSNAVVYQSNNPAIYSTIPSSYSRAYTYFNFNNDLLIEKTNSSIYCTNKNYDKYSDISLIIKRNANGSIDKLESNNECLEKDKNYIIQLKTLKYDKHKNPIQIESVYKYKDYGLEVLKFTTTSRVSYSYNDAQIASELEHKNWKGCLDKVMENLIQRGKKEFNDSAAYTGMGGAGASEYIVAECGNEPITSDICNKIYNDIYLACRNRKFRDFESNEYSIMSELTNNIPDGIDQMCKDTNAPIMDKNAFCSSIISME